MEIFSCSRRSASTLAASFCCSASTRWRVASSAAVRARGGGAAEGAGRVAPAMGRVDGAGAEARLGLAANGGSSVLRAAGESESVLGALEGAAGAAGAPGVRPRFLRTSTCTTLERPCEKLWRTDPPSTTCPASPRAAGRSESLPLVSVWSLPSLMRNQVHFFKRCLRIGL
jgi:hypothetical protein